MDRAAFFKLVRKQPFGGRLAADQVRGVEALLDAWERWAPGADPRFIAYALATAYHETGGKMQPVREIGRGKDRAYGAVVGRFAQAYYGRGHVQLTWLRNYELADAKLRALGVLEPGESLVRDPDLALRADVSAAIVVRGMVEGWFTGRRLEQFFVGTRSDWVDARAIINGRDRAALVAGYGLHFYEGLRAA